VKGRNSDSQINPLKLGGGPERNSNWKRGLAKGELKASGSEEERSKEGTDPRDRG